MVGRKNKAKTCESPSSWMCKLPDDFISEILTRVHTKSAVRTGVLSKRWMNLWKSVHGLDLDSAEFLDMNTFRKFTESFFESHRESLIQKLRLSVHYFDCMPLLTQWTNIATMSKVQHLDVRYNGPFCDVKIPVSVYTCKTLVHLRLAWLVMVNFPEVVSLPCLKFMELECIRHLTEPAVEKLISGSPVLEDLTIIRQSGCARFIQVRSKTLKRLDIDMYTEVEIDAPLLQCLRTRVHVAKNFKIIKLGCSTTLDIDMVFPYVTCSKSEISDILTDIVKFKGLVISSDVLQSIFLHFQRGPLLQFRNLSRLHVKFSKSELQMLPDLLESCPKLQSLVLELIKDPIYRKNREADLVFSTVPPCLVSSLKRMESKRLIRKYEGEVELVRYFLKNSPILEKLTLDTYYPKKGMCDFLKEVVALPRCSTACEVIVL